MDVERAIEHLLKLQSQDEARWHRAEARMDRTDKQINGILKLLKMGARAMADMDDKITALIHSQQRAEGRMDRLERAQERTDARLDRLSAAQERTETSLNRLIRSLEKGRNGRR